MQLYQKAGPFGRRNLFKKTVEGQIIGRVELFAGQVRSGRGGAGRGVGVRGGDPACKVAPVAFHEGAAFTGELLNGAARHAQSRAWSGPGGGPFRGVRLRCGATGQKRIARFSRELVFVPRQRRRVQSVLAGKFGFEGEQSQPAIRRAQGAQAGLLRTGALCQGGAAQGFVAFSFRQHEFQTQCGRAPQAQTAIRRVARLAALRRRQQKVVRAKLHYIRLRGRIRRAVRAGA